VSGSLSHGGATVAASTEGKTAMPEEKKVIRIHLEPGQEGVTLSAVGAASATAPAETIVEATNITEATVIEVEV